MDWTIGKNSVYFWKPLLIVTFLWAANHLFMPITAMAGTGPRIIISEPAARVGGDNIYRWSDTIEFVYEFGAKAENFQPVILLEGCRLWIGGYDSEQHSVAFSLPLKSITLPDDRGYVRWEDGNNDGLLRGEAVIRFMVRDKNGEVTELKDITKKVFWIEHPAKPLPDAVRVLNGPVFQQFDKAKVVVTTPADDWGINPENVDPRYRLVFVRPSLKLPGDAITTEEFGKSVDLPQQHRVEIDIDMNLRPGPYEIRLMRDNFILDTTSVTVVPLLPTMSFKQGPAGEDRMIPVIISVSGFPMGDKKKNESSIGVLIDDGYSEYPNKAFPANFFSGKWVKGEDWDVIVKGRPGNTVRTYVAYPYKTDKDIMTETFAWRVEAIEVAKYTIEPYSESVKQPALEPSWFEFKHRRLFSPGEKFSIKFGDVNEMDQFQIDELRPFSVVIRRNTQWKDPAGEPAGPNDIEVKRFEVSRENLTLKGMMPQESGDYRFNIESNDYVVGNIQPPMRYESLEDMRSSFDTPLIINESRDGDDSTIGGFEDIAEPNDKELEIEEKPVIVKDSFTFSILEEEPPGFTIEIKGGDEVRAEADAFARVTLPRRRLAMPLSLRVFRVSGVSSSGLVFGKSHVKDMFLWMPPNMAGFNYIPGGRKEFPDTEQDVRIGFMSVPGDYEASIIAAPKYEDRKVIPTTTILRHRFRVIAPSLKIDNLILDEKKNELQVSVNIPPKAGIIKKYLSLMIVRPPRLTLNGAVCITNPEHDPVKFDVLPSEYDANSVRFKKYLSYLSSGFEIHLVYKMGSFLGDYPNVILDRKWFTNPKDKHLPPRELLAKAPVDADIDRPERRFPDLTPVEGPKMVVAEKPDSNTAPVELKTYEAPPTLILESGYYPLDTNKTDQLHLGFRLTNRSHKSAKGVMLRVQLFDEHLGHAPSDWKGTNNEFVQDKDGIFGCYVKTLDPDEGFDFFLTGDPPKSGSLLWTAQWQAETEFIGQRTATGRIKTGKPAKILDIITLTDQMGFEDGVYTSPYPFDQPDDGLISTVTLKPKTRKLFLVGKNLPQKPGELRSITSDDSELKYSIMALPDSGNTFWRENYERAWLRFTAGRASSAGDSGLEGLLLYADFEEGVLPGSKLLQLNGGEARWDLRFGNVKGEIMFVREIGSDEFEPIETAYVPEVIRVAVITNVQLPISEILVDLHTSKEGYGERQTYTLTARLTPRLGQGVYITAPIGLSEKNRPALSPPLTGEQDEMMLDVFGDELVNAVALAEVNVPFAKMTFAVPMDPPQTRLSLARTPANEEISYLWKDALKRAAACNDEIKITDWDALNSMEADEIWNFIVFTRQDHYLSQKVTFGHQAAMILLRDMFQVMTQKEIETLEKIQADDRAVRGFLKYMSEFWLDETFPVNRMEVTGPDEKETTFSVAAFDDDKFQAEQFSTPQRTFTADEISAWRINATKQALQKLLETAEESIEMAKEAGDCEIEDLLKITGFGFEAINRKLTPKLMKLKEVKTAAGTKRLYWVPDHKARDWIARIAPLAKTVKEQEFKASVDNDLILAAAAVITMPLMLSESAAVVLVCFAIDLLDLTVTSVKEISQYADSQWEQEFSEGASITIGIERNKQAIEQAKGWASTAFAIGTSAFGVVGGVFDAVDALPKIALARKVSKGRKLARSIKLGELGKLDEPDLEDFLTFAIDSKAKALAEGVDSLSATQRRALEIMDTAAAERKTASISNLDEIPEAHSPNTARLEIDPDSGRPMMPVNNGIKLKKPESSGKIPRGPPDTQTPPIRVTETNIRIDQSSPDFDPSILAAKAGTEVTDPRPFGMMQEAMRHFQETVDRYMLKVRVRAANTSSLKWMHRGHPSKHVKLKSKTINDLDVELGAKPGSQGLVGYFNPKKPANYEQLSQLPEPPKIVSRYKQRLNEYYDNFKDMERLKEKGLISVEEGVVVDRGLASKRLNPETGELDYIAGPKEGTGKGFTGDYDMWDVTHPDGSRIITDPEHPKFDADALRRRQALLEELGSGPANTQHGPHKDWIPTNERDRGIDAKIRDSHRGQRLPDGSIGPLPKSKTRSQSEALLEFRPGKQPAVSYEYDMPEIIDDPSRIDSPSRLVTFSDVDGQMEFIPIAERLGKPGSTSVAYVHSDYPDTHVVRITTEKPGHPAVKLDDFGREALENDIVSEYIRAAKEIDRWDISDEHGTFTRVTIVEKVVPIKTVMKKTGGVMTKAQQEVFENALRDLNRQGYAWLDNKWDNFGFTKNDKGNLMVVVLDAGGIVKIAGSPESAKIIARSMQLYINGPLIEFYPSATRLPAAARIAIRGEETKEKFLNMVDLEAMGLDDVSQVKFTASSGEQFDYIGPSFLEER